MAIRSNKEYTEKEFNGRKVRPVQYFALGKKKRMCGYYYPYNSKKGEFMELIRDRNGVPIPYKQIG